MIATTVPHSAVAFSKLYDALQQVGVHVDLDLTPNPASGVLRGSKGYDAAAVSFTDPGSTRLLYSGRTINEAARLAINAGKDHARDYGVIAALSAVNAQLALDDWFRDQDQP